MLCFNGFQFLGKGTGIVPSNLRVTGLATVHSISPLAGSINGGTILTILGNGFRNTEIKLGASGLCRIINETLTKLTCQTTESDLLDTDASKNVSIVVR